MLNTQFINNIIVSKQQEIATRQQSFPVELIEHIIVEQNNTHTSVYQAIGEQKANNINGIPLICAERSDKTNRLDDVAIVTTAQHYEKNGYKVIAVCSDDIFCSGSEQYVHTIKEEIGLSVIQYDFIIDEYQLFEAKSMGADGVTIMPALSDDCEKIYRLISLAYELGLDVLVEVGHYDELELIVGMPVKLIGINRNSLYYSTLNEAKLSNDDVLMIQSVIPDFIQVVELSLGGEK